MKTIRFSCPKCGQHLSCEPVMLGVQISCPACKKPVMIVTEKVLQSFLTLELEAVALLDDVKAAYRERTKLWDKDRDPNDPVYQAKAAEKTKELNDAFGVVTAYLTGTYTEPRPSPKQAQPEAKPESAPARP